MVKEIQSWFRSALLDWSTEHLRDFPWREADRTLYEVFVAEFFLTETPAENVASVYPDFLRRYPSLDDLDTATQDELVELIRPLGFYNLRAEALTQIAAEYDTLPETVDELVALPRVGTYVANATLCFARGLPRPIVNRNVDRVYGRVFGTRWPDTPRRYNLTLLDFGAAVCTPDPSCKICFATEHCEYYRDEVTT
jgi:A/G-specific adenine glycosylase